MRDDHFKKTMDGFMLKLCDIICGAMAVADDGKKKLTVDEVWAVVQETLLPVIGNRTMVYKRDHKAMYRACLEKALAIIEKGGV